LLGAPEFLDATINLADRGGFRAAIAASGDALRPYPCHRNTNEPEVLSREPLDPVLDWVGKPEFLLG